MIVPSSGLTAFTQTVINTTAAQSASQVTNPTSNATGTAQPGLYSPSPSGTYPLPYGNAAAQLTNPGSTPVQNAYQAVGAQATTSGAAGSTVNGLAPIGPAQGNGQNPSCMQDVIIPNQLNLIYAQLLSMAQYTYRI